ncbi:MAG: nucleotide exchange factor GrpE, partial [bacterium]
AKHEHGKHDHDKKENIQPQAETQADPVETPEMKIAALEVAIKDEKDKYLRMLAEVENRRKRMEREREEFVKYNTIDLISSVLPVLDNMERGLAAAILVKEAGPLKDGIEMTIKQFKDIIAKLGAKEIETVGVYNPHQHHVMQKEYREDKAEGEIIEVYQKGYMLDDKLIREASVKVASKEKPESEIKQ